MAFPAELTAVLTGASLGQLRGWRTTGLLLPEIQSTPRALYSFRDLVALRSFVHLRKDLPLQRIRKALDQLRQWDLTEHPSRYVLLSDGKSIFWAPPDGEEAVDLVARPGQKILLRLEDAFAPFQNLQGRDVADFRHPRPHLRVRETRLGGWPTIEESRVGYDTIAQLVTGGVAPADVQRFYPSVTPEAAEDATDLHHEVRGIRGRAA